MSKIALYNTLRKIPEVSDDEAKEAVADVASSKEMATKLDIAEIKTAMAELKSHILMAIIAAVGVILVGVGLMVKFL